MAILIIILILSYVELLTQDTSLSVGFESVNEYLKLMYGRPPELNSTISDAVRRQVATWGPQGGWNRPHRPLLYLDLRRQGAIGMQQEKMDEHWHVFTSFNGRLIALSSRFKTRRLLNGHCFAGKSTATRCVRMECVATCHCLSQ